MIVNGVTLPDIPAEVLAEKPTRVSIGRSLVDGYAKEVQRLTGTTEQMNAIQIREKLSTVKAAIKIGDTVLPPIPEDVLAEFPYAAIGRNATYNLYFLGMSVTALAYLPAELNSFGNNYVTSTGVGYKLYVYSNNAWVLQEESTTDRFTNGVDENIEFLWSNHNIYTATAYDSETGPTVGTEVYFSERQNFNGVWLPKVPDDVLAQYPYMFVNSVTNADNDPYYYLNFSDAEWFFGKSGLVGNKHDMVASFGKGGGYGCSGSSDPDWFRGAGNVEVNPNIGVGDLGDNKKQIVEWANQDIVEIVNIDMTTGSYTTGDLYFPPLPAIDTDRVSIGYDLCDGIVEEVQRLSGDQDKMDALHAYWKLTTVAAVVTVTDDNTNSGIVIDGVSFPDLPEVNFPYAFIAYHTAGYYYLQYSREPYYADYWKTNSTTANPYYKYSSTSVYYDENDGRIFRLPSAGIGVESIWADYTNESSGMALISYNNKNTQVVWSNYDIYFNYPDNTIAFHSSV